MNEKIIGLLTQDIRDEHAALIQYLTQAYAMGESDLACEMEAIAREEMQHFRWLSEKVVALGGKPTLERGTVVFGAPKIVGMLEADVAAEQTAIRNYRAHIAQIDDPDVVALLERIILDEEAHLGKFQGYTEEQLQKDPEQEVRMEPAVAEPEQQKAAFLQKDATHEYTVVLQYLAHGFTSGSCEMENEMEWQAIEEMRHLGWLAEEMEGIGARAEMVHAPLELPQEPADMLEIDIATEKRVAAEYREQAQALDDPGMSKLFQRIAREEDRHIVIFTELLEEAEAKPEAAPEAPAFTVGPLFGKGQRNS
jgi:bacterioferritin